MQIVNMKDINEWQDTIAKNSIVITDFWAGWCRPCLMLGEIMHKIAESDGTRFERITVAKIDTEAPEFANLSAQLNITSIPTMMIFLKGKQLVFSTPDGNMDRIMGALPQDNLEQLFDALIEEVDKITDDGNGDEEEHHHDHDHSHTN